MVTQLVTYLLFSKFRDKWQVTHWSETWETSSKPSFFRRSLIRAFFPLFMEVSNLTDLFTTGSWESRHSFKSHVGIGSLLNCLFDDGFISFLTSSSVRGWKERNISSSSTGTLGIVIGLGSWLSNFCLFFLIFIINKLPKIACQTFELVRVGVLLLL